MFMHSDLLMEIADTRIRVSTNLTRMTYSQARLFNRIREDFTEYANDNFRPILEAMCQLRQDVLVLRESDTTYNETHHQLVSAGYIMPNQSVVIRLVKDAITLNFGPQSGDNAWEEALIITIDRIKDDMDSELQMPDFYAIYDCFDLLGDFVASGLVDMQDGTHKSVVIEDYVTHSGPVLLRELGVGGEEYLADPVKAKKLSDLSQRIAGRYDVCGPIEYSKWPLTRAENGLWKLDVSGARAHVTEIWIDELMLLHTFHPNAHDMRAETIVKQIKAAWLEHNQ